jgi:hypothetical protein
LPGAGITTVGAAVLEELQIWLARLTRGAGLLVFGWLTVKSGLGFLNSREGHNMIVLAPLFDLEDLRLILLGEQIANRLFVIDVRDKQSVALLFLTSGQRGF